MEKRYDVIEEQNFDIVSTTMSLWEDVVQERDTCMGKDSINPISALIKPWNAGDETVTSPEENCIVELATFFDYDGNDDTWNDLRYDSNALENQVLDELAIRIEEKFMVDLCRNEIKRDAENACKIIYHVVTIDPRIVKKSEFKEIENMLLAAIDKDSLENNRSVNENNSLPTLVIKYVQMKTNEIMKEDTIRYSKLMSIWETGKVSGQGVFDPNEAKNEEEEL